MPGRLEGKVALVIGSTSGIGAATARLFAAEGARVVVSGRREERGEQVVLEIRNAGGEAVYQHLDLTVPSSCDRVCGRAAEEYGGLDVLVNNAGLFTRAGVEETTAEFWDEIFAVNLRGPYLCTRAAIPLLRRRGGGSILNIGSVHPWVAAERLLAYGVAKGGLHTMTRKLAMMLARDRIRVNWVTVGWVLTERERIVQSEQDGKSAEELAAAEERLPMGAFNTEEETAEACLYLASDAAVHVTGTDLNVSGGINVHL